MGEKGAGESANGEIEESFRSPLGVSVDEDEGAEGPVRVSVIIPGLKKKFFNNQEATNAKILFKRDERTFDLQVTLTTKVSSSQSREEKFRYNIRKLPDDIIPEKCTYKVRKDQVVIKLHKTKPRSWSRELAEGGLETDIQEDEVGED